MKQTLIPVNIETRERLIKLKKELKPEFRNGLSYDKTIAFLLSRYEGETRGP